MSSRRCLEKLTHARTLAQNRACAHAHFRKHFPALLFEHTKCSMFPLRGIFQSSHGQTHASQRPGENLDASQYHRVAQRVLGLAMYSNRPTHIMALDTSNSRCKWRKEPAGVRRAAGNYRPAVRLLRLTSGRSL